MLYSKKTRGWSTMKKVTRDGISDYTWLNAAHKVALHRLMNFAERMGLELICDTDDPIVCLACGDELWSDMLKLTSDDAAKVLEFICAMREGVKPAVSLAELERRVAAVEERLGMGTNDITPAPVRAGNSRLVQRFQELCRMAYHLNGRLVGQYELIRPGDTELTLTGATYDPSKLLDTEVHTYVLPADLPQLESMITQHREDFRGKANTVTTGSNGMLVMICIEQGGLLSGLQALAQSASGTLEVGERDENNLLEVIYHRQWGLQTLPEACQDITEARPYYLTPWRDGNKYHFILPYGYDKLLTLLKHDQKL